MKKESVVRVWLYGSPDQPRSTTPFDSQRVSANEMQAEIQKYLNIGWRPTSISQCSCGYQNQDISLVMVFEGPCESDDPSDRDTVLNFSDKKLVMWLICNRLLLLNDIAQCSKQELLRRRGFKNDWLTDIQITLSSRGFPLLA
jgi:hypothetical protein